MDANVEPQEMGDMFIANGKRRMEVVAVDNRGLVTYITATDKGNDVEIEGDTAYLALRILYGLPRERIVGDPRIEKFVAWFASL